MQDESEKPSGSNKSVWRCPECKQKITMLVKPSAPPSCSNPEKHSGKYFVMEKI